MLKRVLFLTYSYERGIRPDVGGFRKPWELAWALKGLGNEVFVLHPRLPGQCPVRDVPSHAFPVWDAPVLRPLSAYLSQLASALRSGRRRRPDVVYYRCGMNILPPLLRPLLGAKVVLEVNADPQEFLRVEGAGRMARWLFLLTERINVCGSDLVVALTPGIKHTLMTRHQVSSERIVVIPSGTDPAHFAPEEPSTARRRIGMDPDRPVVGFIGLFYRHQGIPTLLKAIAGLREVFPKLAGLIVGDGVMREPWQSLAADLGLRDVVHFPGQVPYDQVPSYLNAMDIVVAPFTANRGETSPFKILDALACGRPVVASDIPSVRELAERTAGVILVPPDDSAALAGTLERLARDSAERARLGQQGRKAVERDFAWSVIADTLCRGLTSLETQRA